MGVWIETDGAYQSESAPIVTPCMGVWIETRSRENDTHPEGVTPCMGVWIETGSVKALCLLLLCHTLYGCVD